MNILALMSAMQKRKQFEVAFIAVFSAIILIMFYVVISMNGVVLGNDPAVHLEKAQIFLRTGEISLANLGWTPPLYQIILAILISLSGAVDIGQYIFLVKILTVVVNWLLFMSVYLIGSRFFNRKVGVTAAVLLLMCFPVFEANQFGGYTTVLALAFMLLVFLYTPLAVDRLGYLLVTFFVAFSLVLSHQLATFLAVFILPPVLLFMLIKSKGKNLKVVLALICGGGIAFFLYYFQAMIGYLDLVIAYVFFEIKAYAYQIPAVSFNAFMINFGFVFFLGLLGVVISFWWLRSQKKPLYWLILVLSLFVPFFFAQSYLIGFYMPFGWFVYYITTPLVILAAVSVVFLADKSSAFYRKNRIIFKKNWIRVVTVCLIIALSVMAVYRSSTVYGRIMEASVYYSTTDIKALDAGVWLKDNYPEDSTVICTAVPGFWFQEFSEKNVIAQTDQAVQRMEIAESVLTLSYELEHSQTMLKAYQAKGDTLDENYISLDQVWSRVSYSSGGGDFLNYSLNGIDYHLPLSRLSKEIVFEDQTLPRKITFVFSNDDITLTKTMIFQNTSFPITVSWNLTPQKSQVQNVSLYLSTFFDLKYHFEKVDIPNYMDWINPWDAPEPIKTIEGKIGEENSWAVASFAGVHLKDSYIGLYDDANAVGYSFKFNDLPRWGNVGALGNKQIDAIRFVYEFSEVSAGQTVSSSYQVLALSESSFPTLQPDDLEDLFSYQTGVAVVPRDFRGYIEANDIGFIVYDRNQLDTQMIHSKLLQLIYSNDRYVIFKILR